MGFRSISNGKRLYQSQCFHLQIRTSAFITIRKLSANFCPIKLHLGVSGLGLGPVWAKKWPSHDGISSTSHNLGIQLGTHSLPSMHSTPTKFNPKETMPMCSPRPKPPKTTPKTIKGLQSIQDTTNFQSPIRHSSSTCQGAPLYKSLCQKVGSVIVPPSSNPP